MIEGGGGDNTLYVIGKADLSSYTLTNVSKVEIRSDVTFDTSQLEDFLTLTGDGSSTLRIHSDEPTTFTLKDGIDLSFIGELEIGEGVTLEIDDLDSLGGARILSGSGTLKTDTDLGSMSGYTLTSELAVNGTDPSEARIVNTISREADDDGVTRGTEENDYLIGTAEDDIIDGLGGDDVLVGLGGQDTYQISGSGTKTIIDSGRNSTLDLSLAEGAASLDLSEGGSIAGGVEAGGASIQLGTGTGATGLQPLDILLSQDLSGSFSDDLSTIRTTGFIDDLINGVREIQPNSTFGVASYVDKPLSPFGANSDYEYRTDAPLSLDPEVLRQAYEEMEILSGSDGPEAQLTSLLQIALRAEDSLAYHEEGNIDMDATGIGYRPDALRALVLLTDASYHQAGDGISRNPELAPNNGDKILDGDPAGSGEDYPSIDQVREALEESSIYPIFAVTRYEVSTYEELVDELGYGAVLELESDSSNLVEVLTSSLEDYRADFIADLVGTVYADELTGNSLDNTIQGGAGDDWIYALGGDNQLSGDEDSDTFVLGFSGSSRGTTTITDFVHDEGDKIAFDNDGLMTFIDSELDGDTPLPEDNFVERNTLDDLVADDNGKLIQLQEAIDETTINEEETLEDLEGYLLAFNTDSGHGELWYDDDWSSAAGREQVAALSSLDELAQVTGLGKEDFSLYAAEIA